MARADLEITDLDNSKALEESERKIEGKLLNRKVLHVIPLSYKIDGQRVLGGTCSRRILPRHSDRTKQYRGRPNVRCVCGLL